MPSGSGTLGGMGGATASGAIVGLKPVERLLEALCQSLTIGNAAPEYAAFVAGIERAGATIPPDATDTHWRLHELARACDRAGEALLERGRLEPGVVALRLGLNFRVRLADLPVADALFREIVDAPIEVAANHFAIAGAFRRGGRPVEALDDMLAGIAAYRREVEAVSDPYALDTLAAHVEDAGRIARDIPAREAMRTYFADSLALRERAARLAPDDPDLARAFVEAAVWRAPDLGKASAPWLDLARRLLADREAVGRPVPATGRLRNLVDTAGAPYLSS
jgi:hypothetical protein